MEPQKVCVALSMLFLMHNIISTILLLEKDKRKRRWWVRKMNRDRDKNGYFNLIYKHMKVVDPEQFFIHTRMNKEVYGLLLTLLTESLEKTSIRRPVEPECRLALTLTYLSQGVSHQFLAWTFKMGKSTVRAIILETCDIIWDILSTIYVSEATEHNYKEIAHDFEALWNMPNCVGALDGKHINVMCPPNSGSSFYNYKHNFSIVLLATCDAKYIFTAIDVGAFGSQSDGGIFQESGFGKQLMSGDLPLPPEKHLTKTNYPFPFYFVADAAFPLKSYMMRPFPGNLLNKKKKVFNYRLSRARRVIENAFGILVARWRILKTTLQCNPSNAEKITLAAVALHNFIMLNDQSRSYCPPHFVDWENENNICIPGEWRKTIENDGGPLKSIRMHSNNAAVSAFHLRETLADYFLKEGAIAKQENVTKPHQPNKEI